jgi:hypothetical protein
MTRHAYRRFRSPWASEPRVRHFGSPSIPTPPPPPEFTFPEFPAIEFPAIEFPAPFDAEGAEAKRKRAEEVKALKAIEGKRKGYASTLLTGGRGLEDEPITRRPSLIGS